MKEGVKGIPALWALPCFGDAGGSISITRCGGRRGIGSRRRDPNVEENCHVRWRNGGKKDKRSKKDERTRQQGGGGRGKGGERQERKGWGRGEAGRTCDQGSDRKRKHQLSRHFSESKKRTPVFPSLRRPSSFRQGEARSVLCEQEQEVNGGPREGGLRSGGLTWVAKDHPTSTSTNGSTGRKCHSRGPEDSGFAGALGNHG